MLPNPNMRVYYTNHIKVRIVVTSIFSRAHGNLTGAPNHCLDFPKWLFSLSRLTTIHRHSKPYSHASSQIPQKQGLLDQHGKNNSNTTIIIATFHKWVSPNHQFDRVCNECPGEISHKTQTDCNHFKHTEVMFTTKKGEHKESFCKPCLTVVTYQTDLLMTSQSSKPQKLISNKNHITWQKNTCLFGK